MNSVIRIIFIFERKVAEYGISAIEKIEERSFSGRRSEEAARKLVNLGYVSVYDFGGINDWTYGTVKD